MTTIYAFKLRTNNTVEHIETANDAQQWAQKRRIGFFYNNNTNKLGTSLFMIKNDIDAVEFQLEFGDAFEFCFKQDSEQMLKFNYGDAFQSWALSTGE